VPVLFLTEKRERDARLQGLELGVVDYITKPFDIQEVGLRVRNVLARAAQPVNTHRVTDLPEGELVNERLMTMLYSPEAWAVVAFELRGIDAFRERFGFVAADDVLRALALMMRNAVREQGSDDDFIGHLEHDVFVIITHAASAAGIRERVQTKMHYSREFFYPLQVRASGGALIIDEDEQIDVDAAIIGPHTGHTDVQSLRAAIHTALSIA
jgi:PleD family two-component response regulator